MDLNGRSSETSALLPAERELDDPNESIFDQGLAFDLTTLMDRRQVIKLIALIPLMLIARVGETHVFHPAITPRWPMRWSA